MTTETQDPRLGKPSASSYAITVHCPGQHRFLKTIDPEELRKVEEANTSAKEWAERGSRIHRAIETGDASGLKDDSERDDYELSVKYQSQMLDKWRFDYNIPPGEITGPFREVRLFLNHPDTLEPMISAQLDMYWLWLPGRRALALDAKTGFNPRVPAAEQADQLRVQAVVLWKDQDIDSVRVGHVKQKFVTTASDYTDYEKTDLEWAEYSILYHLWEAEQPSAPLRAGSHCNWCRAKSFCKSAGGYSMLPSVYAGTGLPQKAKERDAAIAGMVEQLSLEDCKLLWSRALVIGKVLDAAKARLKRQDADTLASIGLTQSPGRITREITDTKAVFDFLKAQFNCSDEDLWKALSFTLGGIVKILQEKHEFTEKHATEWVRANFAKWIQTKESEPTLEFK